MQVSKQVQSIWHILTIKNKKIKNKVQLDIFFLPLETLNLTVEGLYQLF